MKFALYLCVVLVLILSISLASFARRDHDQDSRRGSKSLDIKSASTLISTNIDTNDDGFPSVLATGIAVNPRLGRILFSNQFETEPTGESCITSFGENGDAFSLVQGTLVLNISRNNNNADQIVINLTTEDVCFSTESNRFSASQEGDIVEGTGKYEDATGTIQGNFVGTFRAIDTNEGKIIESFSNVTGFSELILEY